MVSVLLICVIVVYSYYIIVFKCFIRVKVSEKCVNSIKFQGYTSEIDQNENIMHHCEFRSVYLFIQSTLMCSTVHKEARKV